MCDSHLIRKLILYANKCLNVREQEEVVEWEKRYSPLPFSAILWVARSVRERKPIVNSKNPSVVNTICIIHSATLMRLPQENLNQSKRGDWRRPQPKWNLTLNKWWNWNSCPKLALSASWTHDLIAQSVRASERNSVVVGSNPT